MLGSQGLVLATAMFQLSGNHDSEQSSEKIPPSCLSSGNDKEKRERNKKKKVKFAENVKEPKGNGEEFRNGYKKRRRILEMNNNNCRNEISGIQKTPNKNNNRIALYNGIIKDRTQRLHLKSGLLLSRYSGRSKLELKHCENIRLKTLSLKFFINTHCFIHHSRDPEIEY
ncbi:hypothetical protein G4B88_023536 [Cannabis sativa]|uniref:Uncharacterized protein n=1 Tax=Cannabis sativa TaxID=3483 RepID=A0A7J6HUQ4_CANSA|nr:hypothetical protein G4B88_023536 [Cannabis sativa]